MKTRTLTLLLLPVVALAGCNIFAPLDSPSGDAQLLSAARACINQGDMECAREHFSKVVSATDAANADLAFGMLHNAGVTAGTFVDAFLAVKDLPNAEKGMGIVNALAGELSLASGVEMRTAVLDAYKVSADISDQKLKSLVRFVAGLALVGELLAEEAGGDGTLSAGDLANNVTTCSGSGGAPACAGEATCDKTGGKLSAGGASPDLRSDAGIEAADFSTGPTFEQLIETFEAIVDAGGDLNASMMQDGGFNSDALSSATSIASQLAGLTGGNAVDRCYRYTLISLGIGE